MSTVIKIENLYKEYRLGVIGHGTLYRDLQSLWAKTRGKPDPNSLLGIADPHDGKDRILALNDINLDVQDGEVLGIIGANGAGKSTLLKILSKVTAPTSGTIKYKGRVASLLEVGTGFHTELTGRENIYLNGAINGMNRQEVSKKLDQITEFAGVGKYLDTPVKRYSSGMHVRLGFAVAAHLDPDILVVDEVLAVGDMEFQKKAIGKMQSVSSEKGRTVLFVSHNMDSIKKLCDKCILIGEGVIIANGNTNDVISQYISGLILDIKPEKIWNGPSKTNKPKNVVPGKELIQIKRLSLQNKFGITPKTFSVTEEIIIELECTIFRNEKQVNIGLQVFNERGIEIFFVRDNSRDGDEVKFHPGTYIFRTIIPANLMNVGVHTVHLGIVGPIGETYIREHNVVSFMVEESTNSLSAKGLWPGQWPETAVRPKFEWSFEKF